MTSDERRDVAKALRGSFLDPTDELEAALLHAFGYTRDDAEYFDLDYGAMLADLIDPTCEDVGDEAHFVCSSCGCRVDRWQGDLDLDPITPTVMEDGEGLVTPRFCPGCGARVVKPNGV